MTRFRVLLALLVLTVGVAPARADAQFDRLRRSVGKKIVDKVAGSESPVAGAAAAVGGGASDGDYTSGGDMSVGTATVIELTPESLDRFLKAYADYDVEVGKRGPEFERYYMCRLEAHDDAAKAACGAPPAGWAEGGNPYVGIEKSVAKAHGYAKTAEFLVVRERIVAYLVTSRRKSDNHAAYKFKPSEREALRSRESALLATSLKSDAGIQ